jgi:hypothetical protein
MTRPQPRTVAPPDPDEAAQDEALMRVDDVLRAMREHADLERGKERASTLLSVGAILMITVGLAWGLWPELGPWSLCVGGAALALMVAISDEMRAPKPAEAPPPEPADPTVPGPSDPGNLHAKGPGATA